MLKVGDKVRLNTSTPEYGLGEVEKGDVGVVAKLSTYLGELVVDFPTQKGWHGNFVEVTLVETEQEQKVSERLTRIEERLTAVEKKLEKTSVATGSITTPKALPKKSNPDELRKEAIEFAKQYVKDREDSKTKFLTDKDTGITVAILFARDGRHGLGISELSSGDVYNEHIGKAIAMARAIGVTPSTQLTHAPQPTKWVLGMRVDTNSEYGVLTIAGESLLDGGKLAIELEGKISGTRIVDDTGARY